MPLFTFWIHFWLASIRTSKGTPPRLSTAITGDNKLSKLSIPKLNHLFTKIGWTSYQRILRSGKREDLTANKFKDIVKEILESLNSHLKMHRVNTIFSRQGDPKKVDISGC